MMNVPIPLRYRSFLHFLPFLFLVDESISLKQGVRLFEGGSSPE